MTSTPAGSARIREIAGRCEKATKGPWRWQDSYDFREHIEHQKQGLEADCENIRDGRMSLEGEQSVLSSWGNDGDDGLSIDLADADFIAHAREDVPYLLQHLADATQRAEDAEAQLRQAQEQLVVNWQWAEIKQLRAEIAQLRQAQAPMIEPLQRDDDPEVAEAIRFNRPAGYVLMTWDAWEGNARVWKERLALAEGRLREYGQLLQEWRNRAHDSGTVGRIYAVCADQLAATLRSPTEG